MEVDDLDSAGQEVAELAAEGFSAPAIAARVGLTERAARARIKVVFAKLGVRNRRDLRAKMTATDWRRTFDRIRGFIDAHGHSRIPEGYSDDHGPLRPLVENIRRHHAGPADDSTEARRGWYMSSPYPGIDYGAELDLLRGWEW
jgi:DNA-binding CsgD family transcriptional regulator